MVCVCVKSLQSCPTLCKPMDCSLPGSSVHGDSPGQNTGVHCHALLQGIFPTQGLNPSLMSPALRGRFFTTSATWETRQSNKSIWILPPKTLSLRFHSAPAHRGWDSASACRRKKFLLLSRGHNGLSWFLTYFPAFLPGPQNHFSSRYLQCAPTSHLPTVVSLLLRDCFYVRKSTLRVLWKSMIFLNWKNELLSK